MVGRSKPQKKMERKPSVDISTAEIRYLKAKNLELAKALADSKAAYTQMVEDRDLIQRELFVTNLHCAKLENFIKNMESASRACMSSIVMASNHATELLQNAHNAIRLKIGTNNIRMPLTNSTINESAHSTPNSSKTQAVKPMIDGHVIFRPTINLRRVNEIPIDEIRRLQSVTQIQPTNRSSSENNVSSSSDNLNQDDSLTHMRMFRNRQPVGSLTEPFSNDEPEDDFTDQASEMSDPPSEPNNVLDTVQEEQEDDLTPETHLNSLGNASNNSLNLTGSGSQVPLLSGVFRDVRVYLSPMQNVAQYLDPRQHVTTERGSSKTNKPKRSYSIHSTRSAENMPKTSNSSAGSRKPSAANVNGSSMPQNEASSSDSLEDSFSASLENSLLSSTKIASPNRTSRTDDLNWIDVANKRNSSRMHAAFPESGTLNGSNSKYLTVKQRHSQNKLMARTSEDSRRSHSGNSKCGPSNYDPLEGSSSMFSETDERKLETLSGLGLTPTFSAVSNKSPKPQPSPARTVIQRRERRKSDENIKKSFYVTKRSSIEKKKAAIVSTKVAKVVVKRLSLTKNRPSGTPPQANSLSPQKSMDSSRRRSTTSSSHKKSNSNASLKRKKAKNEEEDKLNSSFSSASSGASTSVVSSSSKSISSEKRPLKKRNKKSKQELSELESKKSPVVTPKKRGRPKRAAVQASFKEPSLRKKMRRSK